MTRLVYYCYKKEPTPFSQREQRPVVGAELSGRCPNCKAGMGGFICEACGLHIPPGSVLDPLKSDGEVLDIQETEQVYLDVSQLNRSLSAFNKYKLSVSARQVIQEYLQYDANGFRLTNSVDRGVSWQGKMLANSAHFVCLLFVFRKHLCQPIRFGTPDGDQRTC